MTFRHHPQQIAREAANAEVLRAAGLNTADCGTFHGTIVGPGDKEYDKDRQLSDPAFQYYPKLIAYCSQAWAREDVAWCLCVARNNKNLPFVCRSGGHSTAGYSMIQDGLCIDTSHIDFMTYSKGAQGVWVGPGVQFGALNNYLAQYGVHTPGGGCSNVCVGGYMQGGGYGFTSREFGMNCDNVNFIRMMLADGRVVDAWDYNPNNRQNADLFWAVRGGTGNNFGVLLGAIYDTHNLPGIWGAWLQWPLDTTDGVKYAADALHLLQQQYMLSGAPDRFGYMVLITQQKGKDVVMVRAAFNGSESELDALLAPLRAIPGAGPPPWGPPHPPFYPLKKFGNYAEINHDLLEEPWPIPETPDTISWGEDKQSGYIAKTLTVDNWKAILEYFQNRPCPYNLICLEPMGGKINQRAVLYNAFVHRTAAMDFFVDTFWDMAGNGEQQAKKWLDDFMKLVGKHFNGQCYQNYPRAHLVALPSYQQAYWDSAYPTLVKVKKKYDPTNFFKFPQSIIPDVQGMQAVATPIDQYIDQPINYGTKDLFERAA